MAPTSVCWLFVSHLKLQPLSLLGPFQLTAAQPLYALQWAAHSRALLALMAGDAEIYTYLHDGTGAAWFRLAALGVTALMSCVAAWR